MNLNNKDIINFYTNHTGKDTCKKFNITKKNLDKILRDEGVEKHTLSESRMININEGTFKFPPSSAGKHHYNDGTKNYFVTEIEAEKLNLKKGFIKLSDEKRKVRLDRQRETNLKLYNDQNYNNREKSKKSTLEKFGVENYAQTTEYHSKACKKYRYNDISFDSSWEVALYIYAIDHGEDIERTPCSLSYYVNGKEHRYIPDFLYKGELIEIKGDHLIKDGEIRGVYDKGREDDSIYKAKRKCIKDNNVKILIRKDVQFALDYVHHTYGKDYLQSFRNK